ncbi:DUF4172 domain-containing protein [Winogradskyella eckloniae]|uniref:DUF4172 domain-containing protein n=1 Tax=Winogradskyella eckloniae TaxID=1089306 RepID=UPI0015643732|nr:DUF4172 domain-containing protein [Winogradskyella eckloniae]NRD19521.1 DUF4172 domain-containing protein [Winogradskyella eckloniae]
MARNIWNWQQHNWPNFTHNVDALNTLELKFSQNTGTVLGAFKFVILYFFIPSNRISINTFK